MYKLYISYNPRWWDEEASPKELEETTEEYIGECSNMFACVDVNRAKLYEKVHPINKRGTSVLVKNSENRIFAVGFWDEREDLRVMFPSGVQNYGHIVKGY
jgi:hypothetical protein